MRTRSFVLFASGAAFALALLTRCGIAPADGAGGDLGSCQCPSPPDPVVKSGTRLKAIVLKSDDGAQQFVGWWDEKLGVECSVSSADERCEPTAGIGALTTGAGYFADDACSIRAAQSSNGAAPKYCVSEAGFSPLGEQVTSIYQKNSSGDCVAADVSGAVFYACGQTPVPAETFVAMTSAHD